MSGGVRASRILGAARLVGRSGLPVGRNCLAVTAFARQQQCSNTISIEMARKFSVEAAVQGSFSLDLEDDML